VAYKQFSWQWGGVQEIRNSCISVDCCLSRDFWDSFPNIISHIGPSIFILLRSVPSLICIIGIEIFLNYLSLPFRDLHNLS
jgi:hypothetical protein